MMIMKIKNLLMLFMVLSTFSQSEAGNVTDVVKVEFNSDFNPEPYLFKHW